MAENAHDIFLGSFLYSGGVESCIVCCVYGGAVVERVLVVVV